MRRDHVLLTTGIYPPEIGGPATYVARLARTLAADGHRVTVVATKEGRAEERTDGGVRVISLTRDQPLATRTAAVTARVAREARRAGVVYGNGLFLESALASRLARRRLVVKIPSDGAWDHAYNNRLTDLELRDFEVGAVPRGKTGFLRLSQRAACRRADRVVVSSRFLAGVVRSWGIPDDRLFVVPNAVEIPTTPPRFEAGPPEGRLLGLAVGRMIRSKRFEDLLELLTAVPALDLTMAGDGPERERFLARARLLGVVDRVTMVGTLPPSDMGLLYRAHDVFLLPASSESFSYTTIEAMAHGLPVVVADSGALPEVTGEGRWGLVRPLGDVDAWADAVGTLLADPRHYDSVARAGYEAARAHYGWEPVYRSTAALLLGSGASVPERADGAT